jgi:L,D-transpeptidase ErfK/SrfK
MRNQRRSSSLSSGRAVLLGTLATFLAACTFAPQHQAVVPAAPVVPTQPDAAAPRLAALETEHVTLSSPEQLLIGETQVVFARFENTFSSIGREYNLGYEELRRANPGVDQWLPGEGTPIYLPTATILPDAPRQGIVVNVPAMRIFYYTTEKSPADATVTVTKVTSHPIGIGAEGWATPFGEAKVTQKARDPVWYVPASVRKEHAERGDPLPSVVQPGPDNPLGAFAMALSIPGYLIHGTNKPAGVGMRSSHGCIRLYPEDIAELFERVARGTSVRLVNQPVLAAWRDGQLYLEVHPPLAEEKHDLLAEADQALFAALERAGASAANASLDRSAIERIVTEQRGMPLPVLKSTRSLEQYLAASRIVENTTPATATEPEQTAQAAPAGR